MPTYVYACSSCNDTYEVEQRIIENALTDCRCGAKGTLKRVIQPVGISFKGSGFHINDYASSTSAPKAEEKTADKPAEKPAEKVETPAAAETKAPASAPAPASE